MANKDPLRSGAIFSLGGKTDFLKSPRPVVADLSLQRITVPSSPLTSKLQQRSLTDASNDGANGQVSSEPLLLPSPLPKSSAIPSTPTKSNSDPQNVPSIKSSKPTVYLENWWIRRKPNMPGIEVRGTVVNDTSGQVLFSSTVINRINERLVQTKRGSCYGLIGPINEKEMKNNNFSDEIIKAFSNGFPENWMELLGYDLESMKTESAMKAAASASSESAVSSDNNNVIVLEDDMDTEPAKTTTKKVPNRAIKRVAAKKSASKPSVADSSEPAAKRRKLADSDADAPVADKPKRPRGRPRKNPLPAPKPKKSDDSSDSSDEEQERERKKRKKVIEIDDEEEEEEEEDRNEDEKEDSEEEKEKAAPKRRRKMREAEKLLIPFKRTTDDDDSIQKAQSIIDHIAVTKTRSGRRVLPVLEWWRNEGVKHDGMGNIIEITQGTPDHKPRRKRTRKTKTKSSAKREDPDGWTQDDINALELAFRTVRPDKSTDFWAEVAKQVGGKTPDECCRKYEELYPDKKKGKDKPKTKKSDVHSSPLNLDSKMKTLKDKKKLREAVNKANENHEDDAFDSTPFRQKYSKRISFGSDVGDMDQQTTPKSSQNACGDPEDSDEEMIDDITRSPTTLLKDVKQLNRDKTDAFIHRFKQNRSTSDEIQKPAAIQNPNRKPARRGGIEEAIAVIQQLEEADKAQKDLEGRQIDSDDDLEDLDDILDEL